MSQMDLTLKTEMAPITAASMEQGAYERSYEHLVKLQILNEIHSAAEMLVFVEPRLRILTVLLNFDIVTLDSSVTNLKQLLMQGSPTRRGRRRPGQDVEKQDRRGTVLSQVP